MLRSSTRLLNARLITQRPLLTAVRAQSTLSTGEVVKDPQIGDYPNLPRWSAQERGPYGWWDPQDKRNFGETVWPRLNSIRNSQSTTFALTDSNAHANTWS